MEDKEAELNLLKKNSLELLIIADKQHHILELLSPFNDTLLETYQSLVHEVAEEAKTLTEVMEALDRHLKENNEQSCDPKFVRGQMVNIAKAVRVSYDGMRKVIDKTNSAIDHVSENWEWRPSPQIAHLQDDSDE